MGKGGSWPNRERKGDGDGVSWFSGSPSVQLRGSHRTPTEGAVCRLRLKALLRMTMTRAIKRSLVVGLGLMIVLGLTPLAARSTVAPVSAPAGFDGEGSAATDRPLTRDDVTLLLIGGA